MKNEFTKEIYRRKFLTRSLAEYELMLLWQRAHGYMTTDEGELNVIHDEVMLIAEEAVEERKKRLEMGIKE